MVAVTVAIKCHRDPRVLHCIESIERDPDASGSEILIAVACDDPLIPRLQATGHRVLLERDADIGRLCNTLVREAAHDRIVFVDADCTVSAGTLRALHRALDDAMITRADVRFQGGSSAWTRAVARVRQGEYASRPVRAYMPGLSFARSAVSQLRWPPFVEGIGFAVDGEFDDTLRGLGVETTLVPAAQVHHDVTSVPHFLRSAWRTGRATRRLVTRTLRADHERWRWVVTRGFQLRFLPWLISRHREVGALGTLLSMAWLASYRISYHIRRLQRAA